MVGKKVGSNQSDDYSFKWWEHTYNNAAKNIENKKTRLNEEDGTTETVKLPKKRRKDDVTEEKDVIVYARFRKSSILNGTHEKSIREETNLKQELNNHNEIKSIPTVSDEDLHRICEGRTAHKGARHGIHMNGKLKRLEDQETLLITSVAMKTTVEIASDKREKKKKKKKRKSEEDEEFYCILNSIMVSGAHRAFLFGISFNRFFRTKKLKIILPYLFGTATALTYTYHRQTFVTHASMLDFGMNTDANDIYDSALFIADPVTDKTLLQKNSQSYQSRMEIFIMKLQYHLCRQLETYEDGEKHFQVDRWLRQEGGGGISCVLQDGDVFEKAGVNISVVHGKLPVQAIEQMRSRGHQFIARDLPLDFFAAGISSVIHPRNPYVPTVHFNYRYFELIDIDGSVHWWYGGGTDLTPYYLDESDCKHFHLTLKKTCDKHDKTYYNKFKKWCDDYFNISYRDNERRGVGGIFFDDLNEQGQEKCFSFLKACGNSVIPSYLPLVEKNYLKSYSLNEREWQLIRRGRYAEFNLVLDRGTKFGLQTPGSRIESILMSLPAVAMWKYQYPIKDGSEEKKLVQILKNPKEWV
ncbi:unnamed protein product [Didymodactylos carnosus]|uniref:coproporphyrinogen oxidase n=1 Tax=Didymodactylos carnosus TaxID=1234261 RepID=A0A8S2DH39_9BILA|nr:unnamed protein product [Didymodactylos carnosus]CAF3713737.1 unnamed protein product [Didymodactylos carnosus]